MQSTPVNTKWTPEMDQFLRDLAERRLVAREIAARINDRFDFYRPITKNSVIGRASRIGVVLERPVSCRPPKAVEVREKPPAKPPAKKVSAPKIHKEENTPREILAGAKIWELRRNQCRWTDSGGSASAFVFCAEATKPGLSYCPEHHAKAYRPLPPRR